MPYRLRMSAEIGDWIAELCSSAPGSPESLTATEVAAALAAAMSAAELGDLALISDLAAPAAAPVDDSDLRAGVDYMYQRLLEELQEPRRMTAGAAGRRWQAEVDRFRTMKEVTKARITAADGGRQVQLAFLESASLAGDAAEIERARADLATAEAGLLEANAQAVAVLAEARRLLRAIHREVTAVDNTAVDNTAVDNTGDGLDVAAGLLELRADPLGSDVRIVCAVEPPGTLTLLAVLEGAAAIAAHREQAIGLAGELLAEIQAEAAQSAAPGGDNANGELTFAETAAFLARYFPDSRDAVERRAASLAAAWR
jgi:hypothetical protein